MFQGPGLPGVTQCKGVSFESDSEFFATTERKFLKQKRTQQLDRQANRVVCSPCLVATDRTFDNFSQM